MTLRNLCLSGVATLLLIPTAAYSASVPKNSSQATEFQSSDRYAVANNTTDVERNVKLAVSNEFRVFAPGPQTKSTRIDYTIWDEALSQVVLDLGPSLRTRASRPHPNPGTRMITGHKSAYRLEGSRFTFSYITDEYKAGLTEYRRDLESVGTQLDLTSLSKDEQLSYWLNLHNVAVLEQIALAYPTQRPERVKIKVDGKPTPLDEAKFITVKGVKMSPKDIRTQIVYPNWSNPDVMYGFYRGDIGSPILPRYAYDAQNVKYTLEDNGYEFVNSLRGFHESYDKRKVSAIYDEAKPFYFPQWGKDLETHLLKHAKDNVQEEVRSGKPFTIDRYDTMVADLSGGRRLGSSGSPVGGQLNMSPETARMLGEVRRKQENLRGRGEIGQQPKGWVIIEDLYDEPAAADAPTISEQEAEDTAE